jgi:hypothetical protein
MRRNQILFSLLLLLSPASGWAEGREAFIARLSAEDQAESQEEPANPVQAKARADRRRRRIRQAKALLSRGEFRDPRSYDHAALLFQHGTRADDFLVARELAMLASFRRAVINGMPALAEDRYLVHLGHRQRFGGIYRGGALAPVQETGADAVTDALRLDFFQPPLAFAKSRGMEGLVQGDAMALILPRLQARLRPGVQGPDWLTDPSLSPATEVLESLRKRARDRAGRAWIRAEVLRLYREDKLFIPADYYWAADLLAATATGAGDLLLANELAALAVMRQHAAAWRVFARTWDAYAQAMGWRPRYGSRPSSRRADSVHSAVDRMIRRALGRYGC